MVEVRVTRTDLWPLHSGCLEALQLMVSLDLNSFHTSHISFSVGYFAFTNTSASQVKLLKQVIPAGPYRAFRISPKS